MELVDESLTGFLEQSQQPVPYHTQVDLSHDIAVALAYLYCNKKVHQDLSSNKVLLTSCSMAKVTDFGMSKLVDKTHCGLGVHCMPSSNHVTRTEGGSKLLYSVIYILYMIVQHFTAISKYSSATNSHNPANT